MPVKTITYTDQKVHIVDQTLLPGELRYIEILSVKAMAEAICSLRIRGAPALGIAGAYGLVIAANAVSSSDTGQIRTAVNNAARVLKATRPTAYNLFWAIDRMLDVINRHKEASAYELKKVLEIEAGNILKEDMERCRRLGRYGAELLPQKATVLTHCNAGALATADYGTALGVVYAAIETGREVSVFSDETRPLLQGARITASELIQEGIPVTVICDSAAGFVMATHSIDAVIVGADRIAANGDTANKIGTYALAVLAGVHNVPFYVAAPRSTFDFSLASGDDIPIEERKGSEICRGFGVQTCPEGADVYNPAFDVTPARYITAFITEYGVYEPPYTSSLSDLKIK